LKIEIEATETITEIDGVPVRLWEGKTESGIPCKVFVHRIAVHVDQDNAQFEQELLEQMPPSEVIVPLHQILQPVAPDMFADHTGERGFQTIFFDDAYGKECSVQISSMAMCEGDHDDLNVGWIWLGINDAEPQIMKSTAKSLGMKLPPGEVSGWMPYPVPEDVLMSTRMHLNEHQVRALIERLQYWLATGNLKKH